MSESTLFLTEMPLAEEYFLLYLCIINNSVAFLKQKDVSMSNKKVPGKIKESHTDGNVEAFLSYCAYDVRWNMNGNHKNKLNHKTAIQNLINEAAGEKALEGNDNQLVGEGDYKISRKKKPVDNTLITNFII